MIFEAVIITIIISAVIESVIFPIAENQHVGHCYVWVYGSKYVHRHSRCPCSLACAVAASVVAVIFSSSQRCVWKLAAFQRGLSYAIRLCKQDRPIHSGSFRSVLLLLALVGFPGCNFTSPQNLQSQLSFFGRKSEAACRETST